MMTNKDLKPKQIYQKVKLNEENSLRNQLLANREAKKRKTLTKQQQQNSSFNFYQKGILGI